MKILLSTFIAAAAVGFAVSNVHAHGHIYAGGIDTTSDGVNDKLFMQFEHGTTLITATYSSIGGYAESGYEYTGFNTYAARDQSTYPAETSYFSPAGALSGAFIKMQLVSVTSSTGMGKLAFFDAEETTPAWEYVIGGTNDTSTMIFDITEAYYYDGMPIDGTPSVSFSNPFGHIHDREIGVDVAGTYTITWKLIDTGSTAMTDSDTFQQTLSAVPEPSTWILVATGALGLGLYIRRKRAVS